MVTELTKRGVTRATAAELVQRHPAELIEAKLEVFDWLSGRQDKRLAKSPAGYLVKSIADDFAQPKGFVSTAEQQAREEARQAKEREAAEARRRKQQAKAQERAEDEAVAAYRHALTQEQLAQHELDALAQTDDGWLETYQMPGNLPSIKKTMLAMLTDEHIRQIILSRKTQGDRP